MTRRLRNGHDAIAKASGLAEEGTETLARRIGVAARHDEGREIVEDADLATEITGRGPEHRVEARRSPCLLFLMLAARQFPKLADPLVHSQRQIWKAVGIERYILRQTGLKQEELALLGQCRNQPGYKPGYAREARLAKRRGVYVKRQPGRMHRNSGSHGHPFELQGLHRLNHLLGKNAAPQ